MIDAHVHFWNPVRRDDILIVRREPSLEKRAMPEDLLPLLAEAGVDTAVSIQSAPNQSETEHLIETSARVDPVRAVVGWVDLGSPDIASRLRALSCQPKIAGIRAMLNRVEGVDWLADERQRPGISALAESGLSLDLIARTEHVPAIQRIADEFPALTIIVDHGASPPFGRSEFSNWQAATAALASRVNVLTKFSGFAEEAPKNWTTRTVEPALHHLLSNFGPQRIMWASNWPVIDLRGGYIHWAKVSRELLDRAGLNALERKSIEEMTARRAYRIGI